MLCPMVSIPTANSEVVQGRPGQIPIEVLGEEDDEPRLDSREVSSIEVVTILPRTITRALTRAVLDFLCTVARRPSPGEPFNVADCNAADLVNAVTGGRVTATDAVTELVKRVAQADTSAATVTRLNGIISAISGMARLGGMPVAHPTDVHAAELLGAFTLAWAQAGKVVTADPAAMALAGECMPADEAAGETKRAIQSKIIRPSTIGQFFHMLCVWGMIVHSTGLANLLAVQSFTLEVVHQPLAQGSSWQMVHELLLVYLEAIETQPARVTMRLTLGTVFGSGSQDTLRARASQRAREYFKLSSVGFRSPDTHLRDGGKTPGTPGGSKPCWAFNFGKPCKDLDANGKCKHAHKCDAFVRKADGTTGQCGSTEHGRHACTNPNRIQK